MCPSGRSPPEMPPQLQPLRGIIPPMITPLSEADTLDHHGLERLIEHILAGAVHGLFILGTTGEGPSLSSRLRRELISLVCDQVAGRVPVLVGITDTSWAESVSLARHAHQAGAAALVVAPPPYFATTQQELLGYLGRLAASVPLPVFLYNMPVHTKVFIEAETVVAAAEIPGIIGLKDSSGQMAYFHTVRSLLAERPDFSLLVGPEELLAETILLGGHGGVNGGANLFPHLYVNLYQAALAGDLPATRAWHEKIIFLSRRLYTIGKRGSSMLGGLKGALALRGICSETLAEPLAGFSTQERALLAERLREVEAYGEYPHLSARPRWLVSR